MNTRKTMFRWWMILCFGFGPLCLGPILVSCANKNVEETAEGETETTEESVAENSTDSSASTDTGSDEASKSDEAKADEANATEKSETAQKEGAFEPLANNDFENLNFDEQGAKGPDATSEKPAETAATTENLGENLFEKTDASSPTTAESDLGLGAAPSDPVQATAPKTFRASVMPKIPHEAIVKQGASLNRYYFLRKGDSPNSVAQLIYGDESRAADLTHWNSTAWVPGNLIYYVSASNAGDSNMSSLYEERSLKPSSITVKRGESISQIALKRLGHINSWKELAVVNQLERPDSLTRGQKLNYYSDLGEAPQLAAATAIAKVAPVAPPPPQPVVPPPPPTPAAATPPADTKPKIPQRPEKPEVNVSKLLKQNLFFITMALGVGLLLLALVAINRKKRDSGGGGEEFNEDAFAPPRKKRR